MIAICASYLSRLGRAGGAKGTGRPWVAGCAAHAAVALGTGSWYPPPCVSSCCDGWHSSRQGKFKQFGPRVGRTVMSAAGSIRRRGLRRVLHSSMHACRVAHRCIADHEKSPAARPTSAPHQDCPQMQMIAAVESKFHRTRNAKNGFGAHTAVIGAGSVACSTGQWRTRRTPVGRRRSCTVSDGSTPNRFPFLRGKIQKIETPRPRLQGSGR